MVPIEEKIKGHYLRCLDMIEDKNNHQAKVLKCYKSKKLEKVGDH